MKEMKELYQLPLQELFHEILVKAPINHRNEKQIDIRKRIDAIRLQATIDFNEENFIIMFDLHQGENGMKSHFSLASTFNHLSKHETHIVRGLGDMYTMCSLTSILHELGHAIDNKKRSFKTTARGGKANTLRCERNAWLLGLEWGLKHGFISKEELLEFYPQVILCLGSYYSYYHEPFESFDKAQSKILQKLLK